MMELEEARQCELIAAVVMTYRDKHDFIHSPCWMDEWALGYFCALRDTSIINAAQWSFLCQAFQPDEKEISE